MPSTGEVVAGPAGERRLFLRLCQDGLFSSSRGAWPVMNRGRAVGAASASVRRTRDQGALLGESAAEPAASSPLVVCLAVLALFGAFSKTLALPHGCGRCSGGIRDRGGGGVRPPHLQPVPAGTSWPSSPRSSTSSPTACQTTEEVRRRFVSDASHELKTPLASIRLHDGLDPAGCVTSTGRRRGNLWPTSAGRRRPTHPHQPGACWSWTRLDRAVRPGPPVAMRPERAGRTDRPDAGRPWPSAAQVTMTLTSWGRAAWSACNDKDAGPDPDIT